MTPKFIQFLKDKGFMLVVDWSTPTSGGQFYLRNDFTWWGEDRDTHHRSDEKEGMFGLVELTPDYFKSITITSTEEVSMLGLSFEDRLEEFTRRG